MNFFRFVILLAGLFLAGANSCFANESLYTVTVEGTVIALPKDQALRFIAQHHLESDAGQALLDLLAMVERKQAESIANPAVTTKSGQRGVSESGTTKLEVEPVLSPSAQLVDTTLLFNCGATKVATSFTAKSGDLKFLGSFDSPDEATKATYLVFVRAIVSKGD